MQTNAILLQARPDAAYYKPAVVSTITPLSTSATYHFHTPGLLHIHDIILRRDAIYYKTAAVMKSNAILLQQRPDAAYYNPRPSQQSPCAQTPLITITQPPSLPPPPTSIPALVSRAPRTPTTSPRESLTNRRACGHIF